MGKLSLLIPSFNDSRILEILLELHNYSRQDLEVVIQDGGSSDKLLSEIKVLLKSSDKLIIEKDQGIFDAINKGISNCSNEYILTIGTDDFVATESLQTIINKLNSDKEKVFFVPVTMVDPNSLKLIRYWPIRKFSRLRIFLGTQYPHFGLVAKSEIYKTLNFNIANKINADYEFFYNLSGKLKKWDIGYIQDAYVMMRLGGTSTKNITSILSHQIIMIAFAFRTNPILLFGFCFKPFYKIQELVLGIIKKKDFYNRLNAK